MNRQCYYTNESFAQRAGGRVFYTLALITENKPGYSVVQTSLNLPYLQQMAANRNREAGLSDDDVLAIVASSMAAGKAGDA